MEGNLKNTLLMVCELLEKNTVQYIIIGGTAVALNGYYRHSTNISGEIAEKPDVDVWYNPTYKNYYKILEVIEALGTDITEFKKEQSPNPHTSFFKLDLDDFTLDLLPEIKANLKFIDVYSRKEIVEMSGVKIHFMSYADLIKDKEASARKKDMEDIKQLKKKRGNK